METSIIIFISGFILIALILLIYIKLSVRSIEIRDKAVDISEVIPIQCIQDGFIINGSGDVTAGYKIFFPEVFSMTPQECQRFFVDFNGILKNLPSGVVIHQQNQVFETEYKNDGVYSEQNYISKENLKYYVGRPITGCNVYMFITFTENSSIFKSYASSSLLQKPNYPFKQPYKDLEKRKMEIISHLISLENGMKGLANCEVIRMDDITLNNVVFDYLNCSYKYPASDATKEVVNPMSVSPEGVLKVGDQYVGILSLVEEGEILYPLGRVPKTIPSASFENGVNVPENINSEAGMMYPLIFGLPIDHIVNVTIEITDTDSTVAKLAGVSTKLNFLSLFYPPAKRKKDSLDLFIKEIGNSCLTTASTSINVIVTDSDYYHWFRKVGLVKSAFTNMNQSKCFLENYDTANLFFSSIPGNARANYRNFISSSVQAYCYLNREGFYMSDKEGILFLDRFGNPVIVNIWDSPYTTNRNGIIIGPSGKGKSYWANGLILDDICKHVDDIIIDIGGSYKSLVLLNGGVYLDSRNIKEFQFNPFLCKKDKDGKYLYIELDTEDDEATNDTLLFIGSVIAKIWKGDKPLEGEQWQLLEDSIVKFYDYVNENGIFPNLIEYRKFILSPSFIQEEYDQKHFDVRSVSLMLKPYTEGQYKFLLNADRNFDITNDTLICFDMEEAAKAPYFNVVTVMVLHLITEKIKRRQGIKKRLIIDEAFDFLKDPKMGEFIGALYRTFRKKTGSIYLAAQNVSFLMEVSPEIRASILINSDIKAIMNHSGYEASHQHLKNILSITDNEINMISAMQSGDGWRQFFIKIGNHPFVFTMDVSDIADTAFDSKQEVQIEIRRLFKKTGSLQAALNQYIENQRAKYKIPV